MNEVSDNKTIDTYNQSAELLAEHYRSVGAREYDINKAFSLVSKPRPNVVEVGCGNGRDAQLILQLTDSYLGVDLSEGMLRIARERNPKGIFLEQDLATFVVPEDTDIVFAFASILHLPKEKVEQFLKSNHQPLNQNGIIYISTKYSQHYHQEVKKDQFGERTFYFYSPELLTNLAGPGFSAELMETQTINSTDWFTLVLRKQ